MFIDCVLPDGAPARRAATSWRVYRGWVYDWGPRVARLWFLDAVVVGAPVDDALLDGLGFEVLSQGFADQGWEFGVRGEAKSDELLDRELVDVSAVFGGKKRVEAEAFFEADDAVLHFDSPAASNACHDKEDDGHGDPPEMESPVGRPVVDRDEDGEDDVKQEHGQHEEMKEWIPARVIFEILGGGH
jgi:hypothetical protein